ncbi:MAG: type VI secretion system tip protein VgrG [Acetobacteraceae bacterium]|nr:type VI secretion system tip protein VgrG [Acetobacteraceae bacterium]
MADKLTQDDRTLRFDSSAGLPKDTLLLLAVVGQEGLSRPYSYKVELLCEDIHREIDPGVMIGASASIGMRLDRKGAFRFRAGFIRGFQSAGMRGKNFRVYRAEIVPFLSLLAFSSDFRIFQDVTVVDVLETVFQEHGLGLLDMSRLKAADYPRMEYCVQCRETAFDFVSRLMEENGIFYFWRHEETGSTLVIGDDSFDFDKMAPFDLSVGNDEEEGRIHTWEHAFDRRTGAWVLGDFSFTTPADPPIAQEEKTQVKIPAANNIFKRYDFPQHIEITADLQRFTQRRMQAEESQVHAVQGGSQVLPMAPGLRFKLADHAAFPEEKGKGYLVTSLQFTALDRSYDNSTVGEVLAGIFTGLWSTDTAKTLGMAAGADAKGATGSVGEVFSRKFADTLANLGKAALSGGLSGLLSLITDPITNFFKGLLEKKSQFSNSFIAIPDEVMFRPPHTTAKPRIAGPHTAIVVGPNGFDRPGGAEIHTDQWGRVKVKFPWDRDHDGDATGKTSAWLRVTEGWAGGKFGTQFPPRVGQEVLVEFIDGDPDRPIVTGRLYNPGSQQPFDAPGSTPATPPAGPFRPESAVVQTTQRRSGIKTQSTPRPDSARSRFHMLRFDDSWHEEQWLMRCQGRMDVTAFSNYFEKVYGNRHINIGGKDPDTGKGGGAFVLTTGGTYDLHVGDARYEGVDAAMQVSVKGDVAFDFQAKWNNVVGGEATINAQKVVVEASQKITLKVGGNFVVVDSAGVWIKGSMVQINSGGSPDSTSSVTITEPLDAAIADPGDPPNWIALHPPGRGGGRRTHTAQAHHGNSLTPRPDGTWQAYPGVVINSTDPAYVDAVASDLARINDTPTGNAMLNDIGSTGQTVTIQPRPAGTAVTDTQTVPTNMTNGQNGTGTDSRIEYDPSDFPAPGTTTQAPSDVALFHELDHADHAANGNLDMTPRADGYDNNEEFNTIQDENTYRDERGPWPGQPADSHRHDHSFAGF